MTGTRKNHALGKFWYHKFVGWLLKGSFKGKKVFATPENSTKAKRLKILGVRGGGDPLDNLGPQIWPHQFHTMRNQVLRIVR